MQEEFKCIHDLLQTNSMYSSVSGSESQSGGGSCMSVNAGYTIVYDKNIVPRFTRNEHQTCSLHYVHSYAVKDKINFSKLSSNTPTNVNIFDVIPNEEDYKSLLSDLVLLITRMIVKYIPFCHEDFENLPLKHIFHKYSEQMSNRSEISSGFEKNETINLFGQNVIML